MSQLVSAIDLDQIRNTFNELAAIEVTNFEEQVKSLTEAFLQRIKDSVHEKLLVTFTGFATDTLNDLVSDFNRRLQEIFGRYQELLVNDADNIVKDAIKSNASNVSGNTITKINDLFNGDFKNTVQARLTEYNQFGEQVVTNSIAKISEAGVPVVAQ